MIFVDKKLYGKAHNWQIGQEQAWTTRGDFDFVVPDDGYYEIILIGGGGGGGGGTIARCGGGGGTGGKSEQIALQAGAHWHVYVGAGGHGGKSAQIGSIGDSTLFEGSTTRYTANGGGPGKPNGDGGPGYGNLGQAGSDGTYSTPGSGSEGYLYNGVYYGAGGSGGHLRNAGTDGTDGLVVVKLVAYA